MELTNQADPYLRPNTSLRSRAARFVWGAVQATLFAWSPRPCHAWRAWLLRCFGARLGSHCHIYPGARIWAPWNLECEDVVSIADEAIIYNPATIFLGSHAIVSQQAYLCGATHDYHDPGFPMVSSPITVGRYAWVCARAIVQPGITVGEGAILGLAALATKELEPWTIYAGIPAKRIKTRPRPGLRSAPGAAHVPAQPL
ncbi:MAG TPA: putative colanic acid biosynthesis acetyltransferase [Burkholderiales bacterium]|nr:putative colanic acid biosynthesis acetyltransferase [Burkholderiales bacterium]